MDQPDILILGAGASGLLCAILCAEKGRAVAVLDHAGKAGSKLLVSGGGRCNFTNLNATAEDYVSANPHFVKSALARFTPYDVLDFFQDNGLSAEGFETGRLFCAQGARAVADMLLEKARTLGVVLHLNAEIRSLAHGGEGFTVHTDGRNFSAPRVVLATGSLAWPQLGATNIGYEAARSFGHRTTPLRPGLAPLLAPDELLGLCRELSGVSLSVAVSAGNQHILGDLLFTHKGISGPAVLDASLFWRHGEVLRIDFLPGTDIPEALAESPRADVGTVLSRLLPKRLAAALCERHGWRGKIAETSGKTLSDMDGLLHAYPFLPRDTEGFAKAEVTLGGIDTDDVSSKTMESRKVRGLYIIGELLDVTGRLGGYNLQWAWSSAFAAANA